MNTLHKTRAPFAITAMLASALAALAVGAASPAAAMPGVDSRIGSDMSQQVVTADADSWLDHAGMTPYGTYQNDNARKSATHR